MINNKEWYSIEISITQNEIKNLITDYAFSLGCLGMEDLDESVFLEPDLNNYANSSGLKLYFPKEISSDETILKIQQKLEYFKNNNPEIFLENQSKIEFKVDNIPYTNWREEWKKSYKPLKAGCFLIVPSWLKNKAEIIKTYTNEGLLPIYIEPKMAFGTGTHETTRLMLQMITATGVKNLNVLDAGTGSGILAIAMAKLKAKSILAVDVEDESILNTLENINLNNDDISLTNKITVKKIDSETYSENNKFDLISANINRTVLESLLDNFIKVAKNQGTIIFSGVLVDEVAKFRKFVSQNSNLIESSYCEFNEWSSLIYKVKK